MSLKGSKTEENLKAAFAGESQANRRYLYFAQKASHSRLKSAFSLSVVLLRKVDCDVGWRAANCR